jgi:hypothetical protein
VEAKTIHSRVKKDDVRVARIESQLRKREADFWGRTLVKLATGVPVLFLGPLLGGIIVQGLLFLSKAAWQPGYWVCYGIACLIMIPLLFFIEIRNRGDFYFDEARFYHSPGETFSTSLHYTTGGPSDMEAGLAFVEVLLFAPRQILSAISDIKQRKAIGSEELHRASEIVLALQIADGGVALEKLSRAEDSPDSFPRILRYLQFYDWIDISKKADRAWLCSDAKKWLGPPR